MTTTSPTNAPGGTGSTALITGGNRGIGLQTARELAARGWTVWLGARDEGRGAAAVAALADEPGEVRLLALDVTSDDSVEAAATTVEASGTGLDVLVNNAGVIGGRADVADTVASDFLACFGVNLLGPVRVTHAFLPLLTLSPDPRLVMVSSGVGSFGVTNDPERPESTIRSLVYPSSKAALNMVTSQYAKGLPGLRVNAVDPGHTATDLNGHSGPKTVEEGARAVVALATAAPGGPTGGFFDDRGAVPW